MRKTLLFVGLIAAVGLLAYSNSFHVPFQFDDSNNISANPVVQRLGNFISSAKGYSYNPRRFIGYLTFALNYHFGGLDVTGYHLVNLAIHITTACLVYLFVILTFTTPHFKGQAANGKENTQPSDFSLQPSESIALFAALLFVAHPVQTQAVTYIVQRFTSLATMFYLLSVVLYIKGRLTAEKEGRTKGEGLPPLDSPLGKGGLRGMVLPIAYYFFSLVFAVLAMMTKEISFTLPIIIALYEFTFFESSLKKKLLFLLPLLLTLIIIPLNVVGTHRPLGEIISDLSEKTRVQTAIPRWDYLMTQMRVVTTYVRLVFLPINQNLDYDYPVYHSLFAPPVLMSFLFLSSIFGAAVYLIRESRRARRMEQRAKDNSDEAFYPMLSSPCSLRLAGFGIFWFFITLSVESSFIPITDVIFEHRVYLPSVGAFIALSALLFVFIGRVAGGARLSLLVCRPESLVPRLSSAVFAGLLSVVLLMSALTYARNAVWLTPSALWQDVVEKSPGNARAYNNLGYISLGEGRPDQAMGYFLKALALKPAYVEARDNVGVVYYEKGMFDDAIEQFRAALALQPGDADLHHNLGLAYAQKGLKNEALGEFETALKLFPDNYEVYNDMGVMYREKGLNDEAIDCFRKAVEIKPDYAGAHYNLGLAYRAIGLNDKAGEHLAKAHALKPEQF